MMKACSISDRASMETSVVSQIANFCVMSGILFTRAYDKRLGLRFIFKIISMLDNYGNSVRLLCLRVSAYCKSENSGKFRIFFARKINSRDANRAIYRIQSVLYENDEISENYCFLL